MASRATETILIVRATICKVTRLATRIALALLYTVTLLRLLVRLLSLIRLRLCQ